MKRSVRTACLIASLCIATALSGCMAIPVMVAGSTLGNKTQTVVLSGPRFPGDLFREAAIRSGGVVTASNSEYAKAEFHTTAVKVELQLVKAGEYQLIGSSNSGSSMSMNFINGSIAETTQKIADHIAAKDFKILDINANQELATK